LNFEQSICHFKLIFWGGREIAQEGGEMLLKFSPKLEARFWKKLFSSNFQQNHNYNNIRPITDLNVLVRNKQQLSRTFG